MRVSEQLDMAADLIEQRGWVQVTDPKHGEDPWGAGGGPLCLEGAINAAAGLEKLDDTRAANTCPAGAAVRDYLAFPAFDADACLTHLYVFNDAFGRTAAEVVAVLRAASAVESARESASWLRMGTVAVQVGGAA